MRLYVFLIFTALFMAFSAGYYALFIKGSYIATAEDEIKIAVIKNDFKNRYNPLTTMKVSSLLRSDEQIELLKPKNLFQRSTGLQSQDRQIYWTDKKCFEEIATVSSRDDYQKMLIWEEYRCGKRLRLPKHFFYQQPYLHPTGHSYTYLAMMMGKSLYKSKNWLSNHLMFFHVIELQEVQRYLRDLPGIFSILVFFEEGTFLQLLKGVDSLLLKDLYFEKKPTDLSPYTIEYNVYDANDLRSFLLDTPFFIKPFKQGLTCFYREGSICWDYNVKHIFAVANKTSLFLFGATFLIVIVIIIVLMNRLLSDRKEDDRRRFALQVLTHEFRTPITSLLVNLESLLEDIEDLPDSIQEKLFTISSDVHRLRRLAESSRNYLQSGRRKDLINLNVKEVLSINNFVETALENYLDEIEIDFLKQDISFKIDEYWLGIILKNLVENALSHGQKPIRVICSFSDRILRIKVEDQGYCEFENLEEMVSAFKKGSSSSGTGLGLNIVANVVKSMKGQLNFYIKPTTFEISFKEI